MSTSSVRRIKDRGGAGGKVVAMKPSPKTLTTPISNKENQTTLKSLSSKPNPNPSSTRVSSNSLKPSIRPMPRIEKPSGPEPKVRCSTSSVPKGRSSSPSDCNRVLSDIRKTRVPEKSSGEINRSVSNGRRSVSNLRGSGKSRADKEIEEQNLKMNRRIGNGFRVFKDNEDLGRKSEKALSQNGGLKVKSSEMAVKCIKEEANLVLASDKVSGVSDNSNSSCLEVLSNAQVDNLVNGRPYLVSKLETVKDSISSNLEVLSKVEVDKLRERPHSVPKLEAAMGIVKETVASSSSCSKEPVAQILGDSKILKEKGVSEENVCRSGNKYQSKLHDKLAFLEGKVKRIASDIKRTKEMLDMNNPDASKVILSDIQEKISGIEKVMGHVLNDTGAKVGQTGEDSSGKSSVKGLSSEYLEARLFPHHKLLRNRALSKTFSSGSELLKPSTVEARSEGLEEKLLSPFDENPVAREFLALLNQEKPNIITKDRNSGLDSYEIQDMDEQVGSSAQGSTSSPIEKCHVELILTTDEKLEEFDDQENRQAVIVDEPEDASMYQLIEIGRKNSTGGWFVLEGESVLLAHDDGSCSFYDIANSEEKAVYKPPTAVSPNIWRDCWIIRAPGADGCSGRYVVAASAGNTMDSGFCSWDFYTKDVQAFHIEDEMPNLRTALAPLPNNSVYKRNTLSSLLVPENQQWWYKPCGPLIISAASCQKVVRVYDIRDGEKVMRWDLQKPVVMMDYSSPLQWRNRGKVVIAESESISLWDVNSLTPQPLLSVSALGRKISALHINNTDAEVGGGVRQRVTSSEAEGNDGVFCTSDSITLLDFRHPSGLGFKIPKIAVDVHSVFSRGDSIYVGCTNTRSAGKKQPCSEIQQYSVRKQKLVSTYNIPESTAHFHYSTITQVWGNSNLVMGVSGLGLFVFDAIKDEGFPYTSSNSNNQKVREVIGPDDLYSPSFDYLSSHALLISRDRPAQCRYLP
ncbi:hypothetical protein RJ641_021432 [Dillenia turbinata]|uniref:At4g14310 8-bladed propeller domain-containing protein n=1 Tax=Dillenia turbinata TaxID=194707 RepID=A0AAN8UMS7_9MAGN